MPSHIKEKMNMGNNSNSGSDDPIATVLAVNALGSYAAIGLLVYIFNAASGIHPAVSIGIFLCLSYYFGKLVPLKGQIIIGMIIITPLIFGVLMALKVDATWALTWSGAYLAITALSLRKAGSSDDIEHRFLNNQKNRMPKEPKSANHTPDSSSKIVVSQPIHKRVGMCKGTNTQIGGLCNRTLLRCGNCGSAGCQMQRCTNANFEAQRCLTCGTIAIDQ